MATLENLLADFLTQQEAAAELKVCERTLDRWRRLDEGPPDNQARTPHPLSTVKSTGLATRAGASLIMAGQNDRGRNQGLHGQGRPHRGIVVLRAIEVDLDSDIGLAVVLCARIPEGLLSDSEVPDRHRLTSEA